MVSIKINNKAIGYDQPCFIIAEAGINHNGDLSLAKKMVDAAKECGADAVKFQTFTAKEFVSDENEIYEYQSQGQKVRESLLKLFARHEFTQEEWLEIAAYCQKQGIIFFSTPQNETNLDVLLEIGVPLIKVGSDDLINLPLLESYSQKGLPMIISTGMAYLSEVDESVRTIFKHNQQLIILHCVSSYPAADYEINLNRIKTLQQAYPQCLIGYSDHSFGIQAVLGAVALGAKVVEKHFTLDRNLPGPDHCFSADPKELKAIVEGVRCIEKALGSSKIEPNYREMEMRKIAHRSIIALNDIYPGQELTLKNTGLKRPGTGLKPKFLPFLLGKKVKQEIKKNQLIELSHIF